MSDDIKQKIDELADMIKSYNYTSTELRDKLRSAIPTPFKLDPLLSVTLSFEEPISVDELIAIELFNKHYIEITGIKIADQTILFVFNTEDGEDTLEYTMAIYDNVETIELWQYYLLSLVAPSLMEYIKGKKEEVNKFIAFLNEITEKIKIQNKEQRN